MIAYSIYTENMEVIETSLAFFFLKKGYNILEWVSVFIKDMLEISVFLLSNTVWQIQKMDES